MSPPCAIAWRKGCARARPNLVIFGAGRERLPNTTCFAVPGMRAETAVIALDLDGIAVSSGSACSSGKVAASHVLAAMGVDPALARGAIRVSLGFSSTDEEVHRFLSAWNKLARALPKSGTRHGRLTAAWRKVPGARSNETKQT